METYIRTGIITEFSALALPIGTMKETNEIPIEEFVNKLVDNPTSFNLNITDGEYNWTLKPEIMEKELMPFLEQYYCNMIGNRYILDKYCQEILLFLDSNPTHSKINTYAIENNNPVFKEDAISMYNVTIGSNQVPFLVNTILLSEEGKVSYEEISEHVDFFQQSLRKNHKESPLGGCLIIDID
jgi:hypothetical protein